MKVERQMVDLMWVRGQVFNDEHVDPFYIFTPT